MAVNYPIRWWIFISNIAFTGWYWILVLSIPTPKCNEIFIKYLLLPNNLLGNNVNTVIFYDGYILVNIMPHSSELTGIISLRASHVGRYCLAIPLNVGMIFTNIHHKKWQYSLNYLFALHSNTVHLVMSWLLRGHYSLPWSHPSRLYFLSWRRAEPIFFTLTKSDMAKFCHRAMAIWKT